MEHHLNLWDLEKLVRQYLGFNDHVIKEYHELFFVEILDSGRFPNAIYLRPSVTTNYYKQLILQWRSTDFINYSGCNHIYTFRHYLNLIQRNKNCNLMQQDIVSKPLVLFKDNAYRASILRTAC